VEMKASGTTHGPALRPVGPNDGMAWTRWLFRSPDPFTTCPATSAMGQFVVIGSSLH